MGVVPIISEQTYHAPIAVVWHAITDKDQMQQWFFESMTNFRPEVGFETEFIVRSGDIDYPHRWRVIEVLAQERISYRWQYGGLPGDSTVTWELSATPDGTRLKLTHLGIETFPQDNPVFSRESGQKGWDYFLHESLKAFLERTGPS